MKLRTIFCIALLLSCMASVAQRPFAALNHQFSLEKYSAVYASEKSITSEKPFLQNKDKTLDSIAEAKRINAKNKRFCNYLYRKLLYEDFAKIDSPSWQLVINPLFNFELTKNKQNSYFINSRGLELYGRIGKRISFYTDYLENQGFFPDYINSFVKKYRVVPGMGVGRSFKNTGFDYAYAEGAVVFQPNRFFDIALGHGKNFVGDGYRSLLLSDNSFSYPYLRIRTNLWKIQYTNLYTVFTDVEDYAKPAIGYPKKYGTFHTLSCILGKRLQLTLFEAIVWQNRDSSQYRGYELNYLNPILFYHPLNYSLGSPDNSLLGINMKVKLFANCHFYWQLSIDDLYLQKMKEGKGFFQNKIAFQTGVRYFDAFGITNLHLLFEFNHVRPYTYGDKYPMQNYTHYNQALAHPLGANFRELVCMANYSQKRLFSGFKAIYAEYGADSAGIHFGHDIFRSDFEAPNGIESFGNKTLQGLRTKLIHLDANIGLTLNAKTNMNVVLGFMYRKEYNTKTALIYLAFRTSLLNFYSDF